MKLKIYLEGDPVLRGTCEKVKAITPQLQELAMNMCDTMLQAKGIGLAASQVGKKIQLIVYDTTFAEDWGSTAIMFNPEILSGEGVVESLEGCLSLPGRTICVERHATIRVKYMNVFGETVTRTLDGLAAIVVQHEVDHLNGILLGDHEEQ